MVLTHHWRNQRGLRNFGDELSLVLVERYSGSAANWSPLEDAQLLAVGSLLATHFAPAEFWAAFTGTIWGTGRMYDGPAIDLLRADVRALRGRLTLERVKVRNPERVVLGDPGAVGLRFSGSGTG